MRIRCPKLIHWRPSLAITLVAANTPEQRFCKNCADTERHWRLDHLGYCIIQGLNLLVTFMLKVQLHLRDILSIIDSSINLYLQLLKERLRKRLLELEERV